MSFKIGSLFDGSGGFPLAGFLCGGTPVWASEIEPYPIAVTKSRFPHMKHLGSITDIHGGEIEPVDVITFGSPCQDLSVAGKRAGLKHEANGDEETTRSGLFMEAVRIIKEMREATNGAYPRFAVWENVPGAFSSNKGEDFRVVLEELIKIVEPAAVMPDVPKNGWSYADVYCGDDWSLAYRVLDAQHWGVPQRRRRIYLVADFRGERAREVLFEREGLRGHFAEGRTPWQAIASDAERGAGADDREGAVPYTLKIRSGCEGGGKGPLIQTDKSATLATNNDQYLFQPVCISSKQQSLVATENCANTLGANDYKEPQVVFHPIGFDTYNMIPTGDKSVTLRAGSEHNYAPVFQPVAYSIENHPADSRVDIDESGKVQTLTSRMGTGGGNVPMVMEPMPFCKSARARSADDATTWKEGVVANTLNTFDLGEVRANELVVEGQPVYSMKSIARNGAVLAEQANPICASDYKDPDIVAYPKEDVAGVDFRNFNKILDQNFSRTARVHYIVRRLTPTECARLQGFPDKWGHPDIMESMTPQEAQFWIKVQQTHAVINGKKPWKDDVPTATVLKWYNKLHTDSAEYKMWGNGIALPCALYVMQGISEALNEPRN